MNKKRGPQTRSHTWRFSALSQLLVVFFKYTNQSIKSKFCNVLHCLYMTRKRKSIFYFLYWFLNIRGNTAFVPLNSNLFSTFREGTSFPVFKLQPLWSCGLWLLSGWLEGLCVLPLQRSLPLPDYHGSQNSHMLVSKATRTCVQGGLTNVEWKNIKTVAAMTKCLHLWLDCDNVRAS